MFRFLLVITSGNPPIKALFFNFSILSLISCPNCSLKEKESKLKTAILPARDSPTLAIKGKLGEPVRRN